MKPTRDAYDAVVVGSGLGGLSAAAFLGRAGRRVLLVERREEFGGLAAAFRRGPYLFDPAIHMIGQGEGLLLSKILRYLEVDDQVELRADRLVLRGPFPRTHACARRSGSRSTSPPTPRTSRPRRTGCAASWRCASRCTARCTSSRRTSRCASSRRPSSASRRCSSTAPARSARCSTSASTDERLKAARRRVVAVHGPAALQAVVLHHHDAADDVRPRGSVPLRGRHAEPGRRVRLRDRARRRRAGGRQRRAADRDRGRPRDRRRARRRHAGRGARRRRGGRREADVRAARGPRAPAGVVREALPAACGRRCRGWSCSR